MEHRFLIIDSILLLLHLSKLLLRYILWLLLDWHHRLSLHHWLIVNITPLRHNWTIVNHTWVLILVWISIKATYIILISHLSTSFYFSLLCIFYWFPIAKYEYRNWQNTTNTAATNYENNGCYYIILKISTKVFSFDIFCCCLISTIISIWTI